MERILIEMLTLGMRVEFDTVLKKLEDGEPLTVRFSWNVKQDYVKYKKSCEWECFETEEQCIADFIRQSAEIISTVRGLLNDKNS